MAADWIPVTTDLPHKREVLTLSRLTGLNCNEIVGILVQFWSWLSGQSHDGFVSGVFIHQLPSIVSGTTEAFWRRMTKPEVGWLYETDDGIGVPHPERWLDRGAKARLLSARRMTVKRERDKVVVLALRSQRNKSVTTVQNSTEQYRREEKQEKDPLKGKTLPD